MNSHGIFHGIQWNFGIAISYIAAFHENPQNWEDAVSQDIRVMLAFPIFFLATTMTQWICNFPPCLIMIEDVNMFLIPQNNAVSQQLNHFWQWRRIYQTLLPLQWRQNERDGVPNHRRLAVYSIVCSGAAQRKHQSPASLVFVREIHRWPVISPHKGPFTLKMSPFDDVIITSLPDFVGAYHTKVHIDFVGVLSRNTTLFDARHDFIWHYRFEGFKAVHLDDL